MLRDIVPFKFSTWLDAYCFITHNVRVLPQDKSQLILDQLEMTNDQVERLEEGNTLQTSIIFSCLNILLLQVQSLPACKVRVKSQITPIRRLPIEMVSEIADQNALTIRDVTSLRLTNRFFSQSPVLAQAASKKSRWKIYFGGKEIFVIDSLCNHLYADLDCVSDGTDEALNKEDGINLSRISLPPDEVPLTVFTGKHHAFVLCKSNNVYGLGLNLEGELGIGGADEIYQTKPQKFLCPPQEVVRYIAAGEGFTLTACSSGSIYVCGHNSFGSLGLGWELFFRNQHTPQLLKLPNNDKPLQITCGHDHSVILSESKRLYVFGGNQRGQLGLENTDIKNMDLPQQLTLPNGAVPKCVAAGMFHTLVLCENGAIYAFGDNVHNQLGLSLSHPHHQLLSVTTPQLVDIPKGAIIKKMIASELFSMLLCEDGRIFEFGSIRSGNIWRCVRRPNLALLPKGEIPVDIIERFGQFIILFKSGNFIGEHHLRSCNFDENHNAKYTPITSLNELATEIKKLSQSTPSVIHPASPKR